MTAQRDGYAPGRLFVVDIDETLRRDLDGIWWWQWQGHINAGQAAEWMARARDLHALAWLEAAEPAYRFWREQRPGRLRFVALARHPGTRPYSAVTASVGELRAMFGHPPAPPYPAAGRQPPQRMPTARPAADPSSWPPVPPGSEQRLARIRALSAGDARQALIWLSGTTHAEVDRALMAIITPLSRAGTARC